MNGLVGTEDGTPPKKLIFMEQFIFTPENLIENIEKIGAWSSWCLAETALQHYFPEEFDDDGNCDVQREIELCDKIGCKYWHDVIVKFQKEVGYNTPNGFDTDYVNEY